MGLHRTWVFLVPDVTDEDTEFWRLQFPFHLSEEKLWNFSAM